MKLLTKEEEDAHYSAVLRGGIGGGLIGLGLGLGANMLLQRRWAFYRTLTLPLKAFFVSSVGTFTAIIEADRYSRGFESARRGFDDFQDSTARKMAEAQANQTAWEKAMKIGREYRYGIVTASWVASMGGSLAMVSRDKYLTRAQKLVQARVYAQGLTVLILVATAAFEISDSRTKRDEELLRISDPNHPRRVEKKAHYEHYAGEDLWKDMVEAEERRQEARKAALAIDKAKH